MAVAHTPTAAQSRQLMGNTIVLRITYMQGIHHLSNTFYYVCNSAAFTKLNKNTTKQTSSVVQAKDQTVGEITAIVSMCIRIRSDREAVCVCVAVCSCV